eukprot:9481022-Pyramimonas_sp.AAC.1
MDSRFRPWAHVQGIWWTLGSDRRLLPKGSDGLSVQSAGPKRSSGLLVQTAGSCPRDLMDSPFRVWARPRGLMDSRFRPWAPVRGI